MKKNPIGAILVVGLGFFSVLSIVLAVWYVVEAQEAERFRSEIVRMNNTVNLVKAFANETVLYSRTNPVIVPILQQYGLRRPPPTNAPASTNVVRMTTP